MLLSVVLSFRDEEEVLGELIRRMRETLDPLDLEYELVFVNDASDGVSLELLMKYQRTRPKLVLKGWGKK